MEISYLYLDEITKLLDFNDETGKYEKQIGDYSIEINSWNNKLHIRRKWENCIVDVPIEFIKTIVKIDRIRQIMFDKEEE